MYIFIINIDNYVIMLIVYRINCLAESSGVFLWLTVFLLPLY